MKDVVPSEAVLLWADNAPGAKGREAEDCPRLTPFIHSGGAPRAAVIVCPGGGYGGRAAHEGAPIAQWLCRLGLNAFVLDYRVAPYRHPVPLGDAQRAIRMVRHRAPAWNVDPARIGILGFSAGGHLVASAATIFDAGNPQSPDPVEQASCRPDALIACYAVITSGEYGHRGSMENLLGKDADPALLKYLSLEHRVTKDTPPTFLWTTADDQAVPLENSLLFASALRRHGVSVALHVFPHGTHGLGLAPNNPHVALWTDLCADWLTELGFRPGKPRPA